MGSKTIAIIGARLTSTRLPGKQLLPLAGVPLISHIVRRLRLVSQIDQVILATTADKENQPLCDWALENDVIPFPWDGDENDVVGRVDAALKTTNASRFVYVCGDCPFIEPETISGLIEASASISDYGIARFAKPSGAAKYIHEGFDVFNRGFWGRMMEVAEAPFEREHVGAVYFHLNKIIPEEIKWVKDDPKFAELDHRLSVDTKQDYAFASQVYEEWFSHNAPSTIVDLKWVIDQISSRPDLAIINAEVHQKGVTEQVPRVAVLCEAGPSIGMGHLSRACVAAASLQEHLGAVVQLQIRGEPIDYSELTLLPHLWVEQFHLDDHVDCIVTDVKKIDGKLAFLLSSRNDSCRAVGIDVLDDAGTLFDLLWVPSVHIDTKGLSSAAVNRLRYGLDTFLLRKPTTKLEHDAASTGRKSIIVLTGGADPVGLSKTLPGRLLDVLPENVKLDWIQGAYADAPLVEESDPRFSCRRSPPDLHQLVQDYDIALCVFGVTFYECLRAGVPVVTFDPLGAATKGEWSALKSIVPGMVADNIDDAIEALSEHLRSPIHEDLQPLASKLSAGSRNFAYAVKKSILSGRGQGNEAA